jgi:hypothetical protein
MKECNVKSKLVLHQERKKGVNRLPCAVCHYFFSPWLNAKQAKDFIFHFIHGHGSKKKNFSLKEPIHQQTRQ